MNRTIKRRDFLRNAALSASAVAWGGELGCARRESSPAVKAPGAPLQPLSKRGLQDLDSAMGGYVTRGEVPGLVWTVALGDEVHAAAVGSASLGTGGPMRRDSIFRIASMTKPVTALAAMILVEQGKIQLDAPVTKWLPELRARRVLARVDGPLSDTVPAQRDITVRDLLTFKLGFGILMAPPDTYPIQKAVTELELGTLGPPVVNRPPPPDEWMRRFATLPLMHQPGERWMYNAGTQVLGVLLARASGMPFERLLEDEIFEPLGMKDTGFFVSKEKLDRFTTSYSPDPTAHTLVVYDPIQGSAWEQPPAFPDGSAGLVSTVDDYLTFARSVTRGPSGRRPLVSERTLQEMTTDHLTPAEKAVSTDFAPNFWSTNGWGYGMSVTTAPDDISAVPGRYGWGGALGTSWSSDPNTGLVGILLTQRMWDSPALPEVQHVFWKCAYRCLA